MKTKIKFLAACLLIAAGGSCAFAQEVAIKSNLVSDALTTPNLGLECGVGGRSTVNLVYGLNPWEFSDGRKKAKHWVLMPEYRYWFCSRFNGHFLGVHAFGGEMNAANVNLPLPGGFFKGDNLRREVRDYRFQGGFIGAGVTYGYQWILARHWNLEAEVGVGYGHVWYDKFACGKCGAALGDGKSNYLGVTKLGVSFLYLF